MTDSIGTLTIAEFIEARLMEDEAIARTAGEGVYGVWGYAGEFDRETGGEVYLPETRREIRYQGGRVSVEYGGVTRDSEGLTPSVEPEQATHIARHDPARALRQAERDHSMLARHTQEQSIPGTVIIGGGGPLCAGCGVRNGGVAWPCVEVRDLAAVWSDHADYRQEWKS